MNKTAAIVILLITSITAFLGAKAAATAFAYADALTAKTEAVNFNN